MVTPPLHPHPVILTHTWIPTLLLELFVWSPCPPCCSVLCRRSWLPLLPGWNTWPAVLRSGGRQGSCPLLGRTKIILLTTLLSIREYQFTNRTKQECIPVGCIPAAHWPYAGACFWGGVWSGGVSAPRGVCSGGCLLWGGVCSRGCLLWGRGVCVCSRGCLVLGGVWSGGVSAPRGVCSGGCLLWGGVCSRGCLLWGRGVCVCSRGVSGPWGCLLLGGGIPTCTEADTPPVDRITDACKNITLATTSLRPVKIIFAGKCIWGNWILKRIVCELISILFSHLPTSVKRAPNHDTMIVKHSFASDYNLHTLHPTYILILLNSS